MHAASHTLLLHSNSKSCSISRTASVSCSTRRPHPLLHAVAETASPTSVVPKHMRQPPLLKAVDLPKGSKVALAPSSISPSVVRELSPEDFHLFIADAGTDVAIVDFYTDWCGPCKLMSNEFAKMTGIFKHVHFAKFNLGKHEGPFTKRLNVNRLPTFRFYQNGRIVDEVHGARPQELRQLLVHHNRPSFALHPLRSMDE